MPLHSQTIEDKKKKKTERLLKRIMQSNEFGKKNYLPLYMVEENCETTPSFFQENAQPNIDANLKGKNM